MFFYKHTQTISMKTLIINVKAFAGAKSSEIGGVFKDSANKKHLRIKTVKPAESGAANQDIIEILSKNFKISKSSVSLVHGKKSRYKRFSIEFAEEVQIPEFLKNVSSN